MSSILHPEPWVRLGVMRSDEMCKIWPPASSFTRDMTSGCQNAAQRAGRRRQASQEVGNA